MHQNDANEDAGLELSPINLEELVCTKKYIIFHFLFDILQTLSIFAYYRYTLQLLLVLTTCSF